ncbi:MAG: VUT family protein [Pseudomonadota bacterium]
MEVAPAVESHRERATPMQRLLAAVSEFLVGFVRLGTLTLILLPILLASFLTVDIPVRVLDHYFTMDAMRPGNWLSRGDLFMALGAMAGVLIARRFGGDEAARAITAAWGLAALATFAGVAYLAPQLSPGDMPAGRYVAAFVLAAMMGQYLAVGLFDVLRGGTDWWRAPLYALLAGYAVHVILFYSIAYWGSPTPWANWMATDFSLKAALAVAFLWPYRQLRRRLKPRGGLGG